MTLIESLRAVATATDEGAIDWAAVTTAATASTDAGSLAMDEAERAAYAVDVRAARRAIEAATGLAATGPDFIEVQDRHHWIEANVRTFRRALAPLDATPTLLPGVAARVNAASMATLLAVLGRKVVGQYDPPLFGDGDPRLSVVRPNLLGAAAALDVDIDRFRRWIIFHEVAHAAEFEAAPWLVGYLEDRVGRSVDALASGGIDAGAVRDVDLAMTAVEGYAEFVMDRAFDEPAADLRAKLDARRRAGGPLALLLRRLLGLGLKRRQYERGRAFFEAVADARDVRATVAVWEDAAALPTRVELDEPARWIARVDP